MFAGRLRRRGLVAFFTAGSVYLLASFDWRPRPVEGEPIVLVRARSEGPLWAGAARVPLEPALPAVRAGYPPPRPEATRERDPLAVRAAVVASGEARVAIALVDVLLVPKALSDRVRAGVADLSLDAVVVMASHTHSSFGGYDAVPLAQLAGTGRYDQRRFEHLCDRVAAAVRIAAQRPIPVAPELAHGRAPGLTTNRSSPGEAVDDELTALRLRAADGAPVLTLAVAAGHPTTVERRVAELSADVPGEVMRRLEARGGTAMLLQGAVGDASFVDAPDGGTTRFDFAAAGLARSFEDLLARASPTDGVFAYAEAEVGLPPPSADAAVPGLLRRPAANLLALWVPRTARVGALRVGAAVFLFVPGEATHGVAEALRRRVAGHAAGSAHVRVVSLALGYLGYVETPERVRAHAGESRRSYYGPQLVGRLGDGLTAATAAVQ